MAFSSQQNSANIEALSLSLVREFLNRKGLKETLAKLDEECPRTADSISNRIALAKTIKIDWLMKQNKELPTPYRAMLEVIVRYLVDARPKMSTVDTSAARADSKPITSSSPKKLFPLPQPEESTGGGSPEARKPSIPSNTGASKQTDILSIEFAESKQGVSTKVRSQSDTQPLLTRNQDVTKYGMSGGATTRESRFASLQSRGPGAESESPGVQGGFFSQQLPGSKPEPTRILTKPRTGQGLSQGSKSVPTKKVPASNKSLLCEDLEDIDLDIDAPSVFPGKGTTRGAGPAAAAAGFPQGKPLGADNAKALRTVLFGEPTKCFNVEWKQQALMFSDREGLQYGLIQNKGGPCGVLASLQAHIMKHLLFSDTSPQDVTRSLQPTYQARNEALVSSIAEILWRAGDYTSATIATRSLSKSGRERVTHKSRDITDELNVTIFGEEKQLRAFIETNLHQFCGESQCGCILFTVSVILSRGIAQVREDMDEPTCQLLGAHGYCTQELVNLLLTGKAVSNVFDDTVNLGSGNDKKILKGIDKESEIGFLSLFEHYKSCQVGENYKTPVYPIFVVCSESHFLVLFSTSKTLMQQKTQQTCFDLHYYDGLANQREPIRLTIRPGEACMDEVEQELVPPIELCIRTRWKNCLVDWNGTEQLL